MKQKVTFTVQVFATLIMFVTIFVTYLEKGANTPYEIEQKQSKINLEEETSRKISILDNPFTVALSEVLEGY